jgi:hypothetical protein
MRHRNKNPLNQQLINPIHGLMRSTVPKHTNARLDHLGRDFNFIAGRASLVSN